MSGAADIPQRSQGAWQGVAKVTEGRDFCCRSVPQAWWMKTPSNSFTHSSSLREVSPRTAPFPPLSPTNLLRPCGSSAEGGRPFYREGTLTSTSTLPTTICLLEA